MGGCINQESTLLERKIIHGAAGGKCHRRLLWPRPFNGQKIGVCVAGLGPGTEAEGNASPCFAKGISSYHDTMFYCMMYVLA